MHTLQRSKYDSEAGFPHVAEFPVHFYCSSISLLSILWYNIIYARTKASHNSSAPTFVLISKDINSPY